MTVTTRRALLTGLKKVELPSTKLEVGENDVLVKTHLTGICGSDKMFYQGMLPPDKSLPFPIGHESGGTVVEVGSRVREFSPGDKVMAFGWFNTFADYFVAPPEGLQAVPEGLDMDLASLGEPIACAMYSGMNCGVQLGDTAVVYGAGFAGQVIAQVVKAKGAYRTIVIDLSQGKLDLAKKLGADHVINAGQVNPVEAVLDLTSGKGADVVIEAAGSEESINSASAMLKHNGILAFYSWVTTPVTLNISRWHNDSFDIRTTCLVHHTREERKVWTPGVLRPVQQGLVDIRSLISAEYSLDELDEAFQRTLEDDSAVKVIVRP